MLCHGRIGREGIMVYFVIKIKLVIIVGYFKKTLLALIVVY